MLPIKTILYPTDLSPSSEPAYQFACALARDYSARLVVLHVLELPIASLGGSQAVPLSPFDYGRSAAEAKLDALQAAHDGAAFEHHISEGRPLDGILAAAREYSTDMIVMGTHGRSGIRRALLGSVAEAVLRKAPCPVLVVRAPEAAAATAGQQPQAATA